MKKWYVLGALLYFSSCAGTAQPQLKIYNWAGYIPDEIYAQFEEETGIKITLDTIASNEELYAKVKSSGGIYDLVVPSLDYAQILMEEGLVQAIEAANISNIDPLILSYLSSIDPSHRYVAPFAYAPTVIAYDTEYVKEPITGYSIFENPKYRGRMTLLNDMREVLTPALIIRGFSPWDASDKALEAAKKQIIRWRSNILRFDAEGFSKALADGEAWIVQGYPETIWAALNEKKRQSVKFVVPKKGGAAYIDSFMVLKNAANKKEAEAFINFIHRPDIYARISDELRLLCINLPAQALTKEKPLISYKDLSNTTVLKAIPDKDLAAQSRLWETLLAH